MRMRAFGLVLMALLLVPAAWPKDKPKNLKEPLFMAKDFQFSRIDTLCVAPTIDVRLDKSQPVYLSGLSPIRERATADTNVDYFFNILAYKTVHCNPVTATLDDLKPPFKDAWVRKLDFGESRWIFFVAVEDVNTRYSIIESGDNYAIASAYLFDKQASGDKLVWRDRLIYEDYNGVVGRKHRIDVYLSEDAVAGAISTLLARFEPRGKKKIWPGDKVRTDPFDVSCDALWSTLSDVLNKSGKYEVMNIDNPDMMAIFKTGLGMKTGGRVSYAVLHNAEHGCSMQIIQTIFDSMQNDDGNLIKRVKESLSK
jgi:hypothetical protein